MPFVEILFHRRVGEGVVKELRDHLHEALGTVLETADPSHSVTPAMVDLRCIEVGPLDIVRPDILVTVLARREPARHDHRHEIAERLTAVAVGAAPGLDIMVELVLTNRTSNYKYL